jgi:protein-tyrosine kinase
MGRTHEALERAEKEYQENLLGPLPEPLSKWVSPPKRTSNHTVIEWYDDLKTNLLTRYPDRSIKIILFNGTKHSGGCSTTAINFATALANNSKLKVLLVDVNLRTPSLHEVFKIDDTRGLSDLSASSDSMMDQIKKVGPRNLYVLTSGGNYSVPLGLFESVVFDQFLKTVRKKFDYIILDAPPIPRFSECRILARKADGVVLVLEAGKIRRQVALNAKKALEDAGAKLLGVVLNRKKRYIPKWIYRRI